jgi:hypothetical protein
MKTADLQTRFPRRKNRRQPRRTAGNVPAIGQGSLRGCMVRKIIASTRYQGAMLGVCRIVAGQKPASQPFFTPQPSSL